MQQLSTIFEQFEIAIVSFPFVDAPRTKSRPGAGPLGEDIRSTNWPYLLAMITTADHKRWPSDYAILDFAPTGLRVACIVRWKLFTLDNRAFRRRIGHLGEPDTHGCRAALASLFDVGRPH